MPKWTRTQRKRYQDETLERPAATGKDSFTEWNATKKRLKETRRKREKVAAQVAARLLGNERIISIDHAIPGAEHSVIAYHNSLTGVITSPKI